MRYGARAVAVLLALGGVVFCAQGDVAADARAARREPYVGYAYPAGATRGATVEIVLGGQNLRGVKDVLVADGGVQARVLRHLRPLDRKQIGELRARLGEAWKRRRAEQAGRKPPPPRKLGPEEEKVELPDHPMLKEIEDRSPRELQRIATRFLAGSPERRQVNEQLAETVEIEVTVARDAALGERELRLVTAGGLTNPLRFHVGGVPEVLEEEFLGEEPVAVPPVEAPVVVNGQIHPGDADSIRFRAHRGDRLVVELHARRLVPFLADAVPGWFQATATVLDAQGREVAFADDWRFEPDPVLFFEAPADGEYRLEVRDALWRGREDFVYRATIAERPFITRVFPLGVRTGTTRDAAVAGWNLPGPRLELDATAEGGATREAAVQRAGTLSNAVPFVVDTLMEVDETETDREATARSEPVDVPCVVNGRIAAPGDVDVFVFEARAGDELVADVVARRLGSPLDAVLALVDVSGRVIAWNDDRSAPAIGLSTHDADAYLRTRIPKDGAYRVRLADAQRRGGPEFAYRLRISGPRPDVTAFVSPASVNVPAGRAVPLRIHLERHDGFAGDVQIALRDAPEGFSLEGATIPAGCSSARILLRGPPEGTTAPVELRLEARGQVRGAEFVREVTPAEDRLQAFAIRHVVPARHLLACVVGQQRRIGPVPRFDGPAQVRVPVGGAAVVDLRLPARVPSVGVLLELDEPPPGISIDDVALQAQGLSFVVRADAAAARAGTADNLLVEVLVVPPGDPATARARAVSLGYLPIVPIEIVAR